MDEQAALAMLPAHVAAAGDDAAVVEDLVITTDMLHETTDFPPGTTRYTAGWRAVGASLSDVAAMGAEPLAAVAAYGAPAFDERELADFLAGAGAVCERVGTDYVGGDLDEHGEFTVASSAVGRTDRPVYRSGASPGEAVAVTGTLGRSLAALERFESGATERANELFRFEPRIEAGLVLGEFATAMIDSSDGLARSVHQLAAASEVGIELEGTAIPVAEAVAAPLERVLTFGEDFELVFTASPDAIETVRERVEVPIGVVGTVVPAERGVALDGEALPDEGYTHGDSSTEDR